MYTTSTNGAKVQLIRAELTQAIARYARKHGFYARTVRAMTSLRLAAVQEWLAR